MADPALSDSQNQRPARHLELLDKVPVLRHLPAEARVFEPLRYWLESK